MSEMWVFIEMLQVAMALIEFSHKISIFWEEKISSLDSSKFHAYSIIDIGCLMV
jgi:hypothetical protein